MILKLWTTNAHKNVNHELKIVNHGVLKMWKMNDLKNVNHKSALKKCEPQA